MISNWPIAVIIAFLVMVLSNALAQSKFFGGKDNKELSDKHPTYVTPDGKTFAVWGLIYTALTVLVIAQALPSADDRLLSQACPFTGLDVRQRLVLLFLANAFWLPAFNNEWFYPALFIMAAYLILLASVYTDVNSTTASPQYSVGVAMNLSWILVAFMLSLFFCSGLGGGPDAYGAYDVGGSVTLGIVVVLLVCSLACWRAIQACDMAWAFVGAWALQGIYRMQTVPDKVRFPISAMNATLASAAWWSSMLVVASMAIGAGWSIFNRISHPAELPPATNSSLSD